MKPLSITWLLYAFCIHIYAQDSIPKKLIKYKVTFKETYGTSKPGYLAEINDSTLSISSEKVAVKNPSNKASHFKTIDYSQLQTVYLRRQGSTGRGILIGALAGFATGAIVGLIGGDDPACQSPATYSADPNAPLSGSLAGLFSSFGYSMCDAFHMSAGEKALLGGTLGMTTGALIGGIVGAVAKKKFIINGSKEKFNAMQLTVMEKVGSR